MRVLAMLALMALPAQAECLMGKPTQITHDNGKVWTIIQRHGDDVTYTVPQDGFQDSVFKTHLMLFAKQSRQGARSSEVRWSSRLPDLEDLVPGYHFDLNGISKSGDSKALPYRVTGDVMGIYPLTVGDCPYDTLVIDLQTYLNDQPLITGRYYLSAALMVVLHSEVVPVSSGAQIMTTVVGLQ